MLTGAKQGGTVDSAAVHFLLEASPIFYSASIWACSDKVPLSY